MDVMIQHSFVVTSILLLVLRPLAVKYNFVDTPTNRKDHIGKVPLIGGISIFLGLLASYIYCNEFDKSISVVLTFSLLMLILGIWDDIVNLEAKTKLIFQLLLTVLTMYFSNINLESLGFLFGSSYSIELGYFSVPFTIIAILGLTNAFNMIDGIDGLAGNLIIIAIIGIIYSNLPIENSIFIYVLLALVSGLVPFLFMNIMPYQKSKIFLGDGGSLFLGFIVSFALIYNVENATNFTPRLALWCVTIPLFDFFAVVTLRKYEKLSLLSANRDHIHHFLEIFGFSKIVILILLTSAGFGMLILGYFLENNFSSLSFPIFISLFVSYLYTRFYFKIKKKIKIK